MKNFFILMLLSLAFTWNFMSCTKDPSVTSSAEVLSYQSVRLEGYANDVDGKVGFCYSSTIEDPSPENSDYIESFSVKSDNSYTLLVNGLESATKYYYRAYVKKGQMYVLAKKVKTFTTEDFKPEAVDLGLSVKWAICNVGATSPEEYGDYFAWGETTANKFYSWNTYFDTTDGGSTFAKYNNDGGKTVLESANDAATANWGGSWRMPTKVELDELRNYCTWTWTTQNGVKGYKVTGKNGNSIFLPAAGYRYDSGLDLAGSYGFYWSSSLDSSYSYDAYCLNFYSGYIVWISDYRYSGRSVRPVCQ